MSTLETHFTKAVKINKPHGVHIAGTCADRAY